MNYHVKYLIGACVRARSPHRSNSKPKVFMIGQTRIMTLADDSDRFLVEYRSVEYSETKGWVYGTWYPEGWILGHV